MLKSESKVKVRRRKKREIISIVMMYVVVGGVLRTSPCT